ncbi:hypothetical protein EVAR_57789_1 [Eumeta japonica]|uniref:Uncharacterized protein n=1 Tax=Eumeta variegata TaxID=151549 RepID=A0A4C1Y470_EUMVA|nr:hypothetical protein EVAR_57789_1 [Eumeta japonica]
MSRSPALDRHSATRYRPSVRRTCAHRHQLQLSVPRPGCAHGARERSELSPHVTALFPLCTAGDLGPAIGCPMSCVFFIDLFYYTSLID